MIDVFITTLLVWPQFFFYFSIIDFADILAILAPHTKHMNTYENTGTEYDPPLFAEIIVEGNKQLHLHWQFLWLYVKWVSLA